MRNRIILAIFVLMIFGCEFPKNTITKVEIRYRVESIESNKADVVYRNEFGDQILLSEVKLPWEITISVSLSSDDPLYFISSIQGTVGTNESVTVQLDYRYPEDTYFILSGKQTSDFYAHLIRNFSASGVF